MKEFIGQVVAWITEVVATFGYVGVALLLGAETVFPPLPADVVLPLAGSLTAGGRFNFWLMLLASVIGSVGGAAALFGLAAWAGEQRLESWIDRYGKWLLLSKEDPRRARRWFDKHGVWAVLLAQFIPPIRSAVAIPAGLSKMSFALFVLLASMGSLVWNGGLLAAGHFLAGNWSLVDKFLGPPTFIVTALAGLALLVFFSRRLVKRLRQQRNQKINETSPE